MKRPSAFILVSVVIALTALLSACSSSASYESAKEESGYSQDTSYSGYYDNDYDIDSMDMYSYSTAALSESSSAMDSDNGSPAEAPVTAQTAAPSSQSGSAQNIERKIIRNADIDIEAESADDCYNSILSYAVELGGYESSCNIDRREYEKIGYAYINATLKLPPEQLDAFVSRVGELGNVTSSSVTSNEITENYYDLKTRLESKQKALESYYGLLDKSETIDDILSIQHRIDEVTEEIESIKGKLRVYDSMVDESTVNLSITEKYEIAAEEKDFTWDSLTFSSFLRLIRNGFLGVCNFLWSLLQWIVIILISASPILIILAAALYIRKRLIKAGKIKKRSGKQRNNVTTPKYVQITPVPASTFDSVEDDTNDDDKK